MLSCVTFNCYLRVAFDFLRKGPLSCVVFDVYQSARRPALYLAFTLVRAALCLIVTLVRAVLCSV